MLGAIIGANHSQLLQLCREFLNSLMEGCSTVIRGASFSEGGSNFPRKNCMTLDARFPGVPSFL